MSPSQAFTCQGVRRPARYTAQASPPWGVVSPRNRKFSGVPLLTHDQRHGVCACCRDPGLDGALREQPPTPAATPEAPATAATTTTNQLKQLILRHPLGCVLVILVILVISTATGASATTPSPAASAHPTLGRTITPLTRGGLRESTSATAESSA